MKSEEIWRGIGKKGVFLHHAYCLAGEREPLLRELFAFLQEVFRYETRANPDFLLNRFDSFTIEESRRIKDWEAKKAFGERKIIVVAFNSATPEAQNALLKVFEEPSSDTHIFLIVPSADILLPTLLSRVFLVEASVGNGDDTLRRAGEFLKATGAERLDIVKKMADAISEGDMDKQAALDFVGSLERLCVHERKKKQIAPEVFDDLALSRTYLRDRSASVKMLLEHLSLVLPHF